MKTKDKSGQTALRVGLASLVTIMLTACVADPQQSHGQDMSSTSSVQPRRAVYDCGSDGSITVENARTAVRLTDTQGESYDLPASPPSQASRYGEGGLALVVEGREALWMKAGSQPQTCMR